MWRNFSAAAAIACTVTELCLMCPMWRATPSLYAVSECTFAVYVWACPPSLNEPTFKDPPLRQNPSTWFNPLLWLIIISLSSALFLPLILSLSSLYHSHGLEHLQQLGLCQGSTHIMLLENNQICTLRHSPPGVPLSWLTLPCVSAPLSSRAHLQTLNQWCPPH